MQRMITQLLTLVTCMFTVCCWSAVAHAEAESSRARQSITCGSSDNLSPPTDACLQPNSADTAWRYVGQTAGQPCPDDIPGWTSQRLFDNAEIPFQTGLSNYCVFESNVTNPNSAPLTNRLCSVDPGFDQCLTQLNRDSASLAPMASDSANLMWEGFREFFLEQIGSFGALPVGPQNVRLSILDSEPTGFNQDRNGSGVSSHGFTLLNIVRDSICPTIGPCPVQLRSQLALPMQRCGSNTGFCIDPSQGGYAGTIGQLATAIYTEVENWRAASVNKLVINLSLGWDSFYGDDDPINSSRVSVQAVYRALNYASCRGALVIAAAGNRVTGPTAMTGPILPGGWEDVTAPDAVMCNNLFGFTPDPLTIAGSYRPLIYAVSSVDETGAAAETRPGGEPRLTAFGDHAVAPVNEGATPFPTQILTGSSVGSVVVASAAAAAWTIANNASPHQIMQELYSSGVDLGRSAAFCNTTQSECTDEVRRISICGAVDKVCTSLTAGPCPDFNCALPDDVRPGVSEVELVSLFAGASTVALDMFTSQEAFDDCRTGYVLNYEPGTNIDNPCPQSQYFGLQATPWTDGQPEGQFCPTCTDVYHSPGKLYLEIDSGLEGTLKDITLICGVNAFRVDGELVAGSKLVLTEIPQGCEFENVAMAYSLDNGSGNLSSVASPSLLLADRDEDDVQDGLDNCVDVSNPDQTDADGDGFGNACDGDYNGDCTVNFLDVFLLGEAFLELDGVIDLTGDLTVNFLDLARLSELVFQPPGPSGIAECVPQTLD
ncbi:MAG: hypothetical protein AB8G18_14300 [Gammaproteobacteria bacterium]